MPRRRRILTIVNEGQEIGNRVREARKRRGLTQKELAVASGLSISLVTKLESGALDGVRLETAHRLAVVLGLPTSELASGPDAPEPDRESADLWAPLRDALDGAGAVEPDDEPTIGGRRGGAGPTGGGAGGSRRAQRPGRRPALMRDAASLWGRACVQ